MVLISATMNSSGNPCNNIDLTTDSLLLTGVGTLTKAGTVDLTVSNLKRKTDSLTCWRQLRSVAPSIPVKDCQSWCNITAPSGITGTSSHFLYFYPMPDSINTRVNSFLVLQLSCQRLRQLQHLVALRSSALCSKYASRHVVWLKTIKVDCEANTLREVNFSTPSFLSLFISPCLISLFAPASHLPCFMTPSTNLLHLPASVIRPFSSSVQWL